MYVYCTTLPHTIHDSVNRGVEIRPSSPHLTPFLQWDPQALRNTDNTHAFWMNLHTVCPQSPCTCMFDSRKCTYLNTYTHTCFWNCYQIIYFIFVCNFISEIWVYQRVYTYCIFGHLHVTHTNIAKLSSSEAFQKYPQWLQTAAPCLIWELSAVDKGR